MHRIAVIPGDGIGPEAIREGFRNARWPARFQVLNLAPPVIVDSANHQWLLANPGAEVVIDLASATLEMNGKRVPFPIDRFSRYCLMNGIDQLGFLLEQDAAIRRYEQAHA